MRTGGRFSPGLAAATSAEPLEGVARRLLQQAGCVDIRPLLLTLNGGSRCIDGVRYLEGAQSAFLMTRIWQGHLAGYPHGASGSTQFRSWKRSGWASHPLSNARRRRATVLICVKCANDRGRSQHHGRHTLVEAPRSLQSAWYDRVRQNHRRLVAIVMTYRQTHQTRITNSRRHALLRRV